MSDRAAAPDMGRNVAEYSVKELAFAIKRTVEDTYGYVRLRGEISGYRGPHSSGHHYFALKDDKAKIEAVVWRGTASKLKFRPEEGMEVIATGKVTTFPNGSKYQIVIEQLEPAGAGALMALLEERKKKLQAEGLFAEERKRPLPFLPRVVGVITSPTGAVIQDILHVFEGRFPVHVIVWPVRVQGETCAAEVARAIEGFSRQIDGVPRPDVLIVARGGGSLEDLWGFNEEIVARATVASAIPVISAVGHETDTTLIDYVSDRRASTPTKAAETAVPLYSELAQRVGELGVRLGGSQSRFVGDQRNRFLSVSRGLPKLQDLVAMPRQRLDTASSRLGRGLMTNAQAHRNRYERVQGRLSPVVLRNRLQQGRDRVAVLGDLMLREFSGEVKRQRVRLTQNGKLLGTLSYQSVLSRGFALVRGEDNEPVKSATALAVGERFEVEFADGTMAGVRDDGSGASDITPRRKTRKSGQTSSSNDRTGKPSSDQGSLF